MLDLDTLGPYLNDHRAGATAAIHLLDRLVESDDLAVDRGHVDDLRRRIRADLDVLEAMMERLGVPRDQVRAAGGWMGEKLAQLRTSEVVTGSPALSQLLELEAIAVGVQGKLCLWQALGTHAELDERLDAVELDGLAARARVQADDVEVLRLELARRAFRDGAT